MSGTELGCGLYVMFGLLSLESDCRLLYKDSFRFMFLLRIYIYDIRFYDSAIYLNYLLFYIYEADLLSFILSFR